MSRVLIIGLDGFGPDFAARAFAAGLMPFLADRAAAGVFGSAASTVPPVSTAAWTTIITGVGIGKHGVVDFRRRDIADYAFTAPGRLVTSGDVRWPRVYDLAGAAGLRTFVLNLPVTFPARPLNGVMVTGVLTPPGDGRGCWPPDFRVYLTDYAYDLGDAVPDTLAGLCRELEALARSRVRVAAGAFTRERFDLGVVVFTGPDRLFHRYYEEVYAAPEPAAAAGNYLRALDAACESVYEAFGGDAALIVCSDHGFGPGPTAVFYANRLLKKEGFLRTGVDVRHYLRNVIWAGVKRFFGGAAALPVDWRRSAAYAFPLYMRWGGVVLNVHGEQRQGYVSPERRELIQETIRRALLEEWRGDGAGGGWVRAREELYVGPAAANLPHLIFEAPRWFTVSEAKGPGPITRPYRDVLKRGEHSPRAMILLAARGAPDKLPAAASIADVAASAAGVLGLNHGGMDGQPLIGDGGVAGR